MSPKKIIEVWCKTCPLKPRDKQPRKESFNYRKPFIASYELDKTDPPMSMLLGWEYARIWERENAKSFQKWNKNYRSNEIYRNRTISLRKYLKEQSEANRLKRNKNLLIEEPKNTKTDVNESKEIKNNVCTCPVPKPVTPLRCNNCGAIVSTSSSDPKNHPNSNSNKNEGLYENCNKPIPNPAKE